jgi:glycosyltransferase involved in cell wall biosynthesis
MKQQPKVGIVIPCYNQKQHIVNAIESVIIQQYDNKVVCIIDDGSTDGLENYLLEIIGKQPSCQYINNKKTQCFKYCDVDFRFYRNETPTGPSAARNRGFEILYDCDCFIPLDADDQFYTAYKISLCVEKFIANPHNIGIVYHDVLIRNINNNTELYEYREPYSRQRLEQECIICNSPLLSQLAISTVGGYDSSLRVCEDWDLWLRITTRFMAIHIPECLSVYSVTGENTSDTVDKSIWQQSWNIIGQRIQQQKQRH